MVQNSANLKPSKIKTKPITYQLDYSTNLQANKITQNQTKPNTDWKPLYLFLIYFSLLSLFFF